MIQNWLGAPHTDSGDFRIRISKLHSHTDLGSDFSEVLTLVHVLMLRPVDAIRFAPSAKEASQYQEAVGNVLQQRCAIICAAQESRNATASEPGAVIDLDG